MTALSAGLSTEKVDNPDQTGAPNPDDPSRVPEHANSNSDLTSHERPTPAACPILRVAVAAPLADLFDYLPPPNKAPTPAIQPGMRVLAPFGRGRRVGIVGALADQSTLPPERLKPIIAVLDTRALLSPADIDFVLWSARYYKAPPGEALFSALPSRLRRRETARPAGRPGWKPTQAGQSLSTADLGRAPRQQAALERLQQSPAGLSSQQLTSALGSCAPVLRSLADKGLVEPCTLPPEDDSVHAVTEQQSAPELNPDQLAAVTAVRDSQGFAGFLLDGVTGSGKTEVYLRLMLDALAAGQQVLILVPEIGLTPQLEQRLRARIPATMAVLHSGLTDTERELNWQRAARGEARVLLGTRSAIFTPLPALGLVIVDEEHDLSLKQQDGFRYSARDLAVRRAQLRQCPVVLGSATPALESWRNAELGRYRRLILPRRAGQARDPRILITDIRGQYLETGLGNVLLNRLEETISAGRQVLLFLNRRGFSPVLTCHDCGWISECIRCDARLTIHRGHNELRCHHCGLIRPLPPRCPYCDSPDLRPLGQGTERVEDTLRKRFPGIPLARIDRDSTSRKGELQRLLAGAASGEFRILLGTQMLAKGHHLPGITLVGILDLDYGLYGADFRATERMAQLLLQVAGRAGRAESPGTVILQTRHPHHPMLRTLLEHGYGAFARAALEERKAAGLPPFSYQVLIRADSTREQAALEFLQHLATAVKPELPPGIELWGPAPAAMEHRAGRHRAQLLVQGPSRKRLHGAIDRLLPRLRTLPRPSDLRLSLDVDPQESM